MSKAIIFREGHLYYLDQTRLPYKEVYRECRGLKDAYEAIKKLKVRGAPLIGVFCAYSVYISLAKFKGKRRDFLSYLDKVVTYLKSCRPTAVNLSWALSRIIKAVYNSTAEDIKELKRIILKEAEAIYAEDVILCERIARFGVSLIKKGDAILTHCNTGFLATSHYGTALGIIYAAKQRYRKIKVYVDETRPLLQGARLTCWELKKKKIDAILICDDMAAYLCQKKMVDKIFVGADRIAKNGDVANKIGTYNLAILAHYHRIPFYVVAPLTSFDLSIETGKYIPIEQRDPNEVRKILGKFRIVPKNFKVYNPAFDITPHKLITAIVTDKGIIYPPFKQNIRRLSQNLR